MGTPIKVKLRERGTSLRGWALARGYEVRTVQNAVKRWEHRLDRAPHGGLSRRIMADLRQELEA